MGGVCARDVAIGGGSDASGAYKVEADVEVDGVCSNSGSDMELRIVHRGAGGEN